VNRLGQSVKHQLNRITGKVFTLPVLVLFPHSACNCRCVMCDIWKANQNRQELSPADLEPHIAAIRKLNVRQIVLSGGEALLHSNLWAFCAPLKAEGISLTLLSSGLLLERHAESIVRWCDEVIVSLDGSPAIHDSIRNIPHAFDRLAAGVSALRKADPEYRVKGRCVLQRLNFHDLPGIIDTAHQVGLNQISFLAADVSSGAFNRPIPWDGERAFTIALDSGELERFRVVVEEVIANYPAEFLSGFIAESPEKLRSIREYFSAILDTASFPHQPCNAPWVSAVIEADGAVKPCFFHPAFGNLEDSRLDNVLNSKQAVAFRRKLDVDTDPICQRCVCRLNFNPLHSLPG